MTVEAYRDTLQALQEAILVETAEKQESMTVGKLGEETREGPADTVFEVDAVAETVMEDVLTEKAAEHKLSFKLVNEEAAQQTYGEGEPDHWMILDTIDGSREIGADNGSAHSLGAVAPGTERPSLSDVTVAVQTEIPPSFQDTGKQYRWTEEKGIETHRFEVDDEMTCLDADVPRRELSGMHNTFWCWFPPFKGERVLTEHVRTTVEERALEEETEVYPAMYISTGGQLAKLATGRYSVVADLRPLEAEYEGADDGHICRPYDICTYKAFETMGVSVYQFKPDGDGYRVEEGIDVPFDIDTPVSWVAYANETVAEQVHDVLIDAVEERGIPITRAGE